MAQPAAQAQPSFFARIFTTAPRGQWANDAKQQQDKPNEFIVMRWNLLFLFFCFVIIPLPLWIDLFSPAFEAAYTIFVGWLGAILLTVCAIRSLAAMRWMQQVVDKDWDVEIPRNTPEEIERANNLQHLVMMCGYKEPMVVIQASIDSLATQTQAKRLIVVLGLEEGTPDVGEKAEALKNRYKNSFKRFTVTRHPKQWAGGREIRGKCSNANYTMRAAVSRLEEFGQLNLDGTTATSCDTDSIFPPRYFENLGYQFLTTSNAKEVVWQAPLFYNHQLGARPFYVRAIALLRAAFMLGFLIPYSINTMSIFSFSLDLCIKGEFFHAHYQMDDIIYTLTCMQALQKRIKILMIPAPVISGPTSGISQCDEFSEWWRQSERWTIGACEVFHYFMVKRRRYSCSAAMSYGTWFVIYYGFILCSLTLTGVAGFINYGLSHLKSDVQMSLNVQPLSPYTDHITTGVGLASLAWTYVIFASFFIIDWQGVRLVEHLGMKKVGEERTGFFQNLKDWILMWPSLVMYSVVSYYAILKVAVLGKKVCGHDPSSKEGLGVGLAVAELPAPVAAEPLPSLLTSTADPTHNELAK
jgi:cellulose synthase/poly-beta-1,6-N-acetylglucosamine synthase-like glycosyltransferase